MIIQEKIDITVCPSNVKYWKDFGYECVVSDKLEVYVTQLKKNSNYSVMCKCDECGHNYIQRISRNVDVCGSCRTKNANKNNKHGKKNLKYAAPKKEVLVQDIQKNMTKSEICKKYNINFSVLNRWLSEHDIKLQKYHGRKYFKDDVSEKNAITLIQQNVQYKSSIYEISNKTGIPRNIINKLRSENKVEIKTLFDVWELEYKEICNKIDFYVRENDKKSLMQISNEQNISIEQLKRAFKEHQIPVKLHSYNKSKGELECKEYINSVGYDCYSAMLNKTYEIDCYVNSMKFGVEYCGEYWHRYEILKNNKNYHKNKMEFCDNFGINIMTIFESEWTCKQDIIKSMIKSRLNKNDKIFARKCHVVEISARDAKEFHSKNHMSGGINCSINIALKYDNEIVSVLSILKSRFNKQFEYEIGRFSSKLNHVVVGGLSKMFNYFVNTYKPKSCMTYADLRFGKGNSYTKIGFKLIGKTPPNYFYFKKGGHELESRLKFQKHKLKNMIGYSEEKTEYEIMNDSGYFRLYDCGNNKYVWNSPNI